MEADLVPRNRPDRADFLGQQRTSRSRGKKDRAFVREVVRHGLVQLPTLLERLDGTPIDAERRRSLRERLRTDFRELRARG